MEPAKYQSVSDNTSYEARMELIAMKLKLLLSNVALTKRECHAYNIDPLDAIELELINQ